MALRPSVTAITRPRDARIEFYNPIIWHMEKSQLNLYLDVELIQRIKHAAIDEEKRLSDFVAHALEVYLGDPETSEEKK